MAYLDNLPAEAKARYKKKLETVGLDQCPYQIPALTWVNDPTSWPDLQYPEVYEYLINTPGVFTREAMKNRRSLDAYNQFQSGWVQTVWHLFPGDDKSVIVMKSDVRPSQRCNDEPHHPWIAINTKDCCVLAAHCTCLAGLGESCSHVAALMFKVEAAVRIGYTSAACTDLPCKWNEDFVKKVKPQTVDKIRFYSVKAVDKASTRRKKRFVPPPSTPDEQLRLLECLAKVTPPPVALSLYDDFSHPFHHKAPVPRQVRLPLSLRSLFSEDNRSLAISELVNKAETAYDNIQRTNEDQIKLLESTTVSQTRSLEWRELRAGRITGSVVHQVLHTNEAKPSQSLIKKICQVAHPPGRPNLEDPRGWGRAHEEDAFKLYIYTMEDCHEGVQVTKPGLKLSVDHPYLGASADGVMTCTCHNQPRLLEIKCPFSKRNIKTTEELLDPNFYIDRNGFLKNNHPYYSQVQMEMFCYEMLECDVFVWTPNMSLAVPVNFDPDFKSNLVPRLTNFFCKVLLPELLTRKIESGDLNQPIQDTDTNLYCICQKVSDGEMIGCDNPKCKYQWFHLSCLKLKRVPKGLWLCKECKKAKK